MIQKQLLQGSFRGVNFSFEDLAESGGRRVKIHDFVNSNKIISEDLGASPKAFSIRMVLSADISKINFGVLGLASVENVDYFSKKERILKALNQPGNGLLIHPTKGSFKVAVTAPYTFNENIGTLGKATIDVNFVVVEDIIPLKPKPFSANAMFNAGEKIIQEMLAPKKKFNILDAIGWNYVKGKFDELSDKFNKMLEESGINMALEAYNDLTSAIKAAGDYYTTSLKAGIQNPIGLFFSYTGLYANNPFETFYFMAEWYNYGDDEAEYTPSTKSNAGLLDNQDTYKQVIQAQSLLISVNQAALIDYQDDEQLQSIVDMINTQYDKVLRLRKNAADDSISAQIRAHKVAFNNFIKEIAVTVPKITPIAVKSESLITLCYNYYDNLDNMDAIQGLNVFNDPSLINGSIRVLSA